MKKKLLLMGLIIISGLAIYIKNYTKEPMNPEERNIYNIYKSDNFDTKIKTKKIEETTNLKILNYNIHRGKDIDNNYTLEQIINFIKMSDADIVCLQEVLFSQHISIRDMTKLKSQFVANINIPIASTGVAIYSKYPIIESNHIKLTSKEEGRGALHTVFRIDEKLINVINVHLGLDNYERDIQIKEIVEYTEKLEGDVIIAGDYNEKSLKIDGFTDIGKYHGYDEYSTFKPFDSRIDYIFMSNDEIYSTSYKRVEINLSDHYPIIANIKYKPDYYPVLETIE